MSRLSFACGNTIILKQYEQIIKCLGSTGVQASPGVAI